MRHALAALLTLAAACAHAPEPAPEAEATPIVLGESRTIESTALDETRTFNVYLPQGYAAANRRYPVLYLIDGGLEQDFVHIAGLAQYGALSGLFGEMIVVGVETRDRRSELTYPSTDEKERADYPASGGSAEFRKFLFRELKPKVDALYRTDGRDALMGESLAGLFIVETFLEAPNSVDAYIAISPSLWWDFGRLGLNAKKKLDDGPPRRLYLAIADETGIMRKSLLSLVNAVKKEEVEGLAWMFSDRADLTHANIYHREALEALIWTFPPKTK